MKIRRQFPRASSLRRRAKHNVEPRRQLADTGVLDRREIDRDRLAGLWVGDAAVDEVAIVGPRPLDVALRRQQLLAPFADLEVDMRRAAGIGDRLDRAEIVFAARAGQETAEALEVGVALVA